MNIWWLIGLFLGVYTSICLFFWISGRRYDRKSEKTKEEIIGELQAFDFETKKLKEETFREMQNDDLYKSVH